MPGKRRCQARHHGPLPDSGFSQQLL